MFAIQATKVHKQMIEQTTIVVNSGKRVKINLSPPVALAAVCSKVIHCLLLLPLLYGCFVFGPCFVVQYLVLSVISSFAITSLGKIILIAF